MSKDTKPQEEMPQEEATVDTSSSEILDEIRDEILAEEQLEAELEACKEKIEKQQKEYLLLMADFDNFRKRTLREKSDLLKSGGESCLKNILPVIDDFERAISAANDASDVEALKEGVNLIYSKFLSYLTAQGVKEIAATGETFDTEYHEAVTLFPAPSPELKGKVVDCMQKGYTLNDKVIRFAKVVVGE